VEYLFAATILMGVLQFIAGWLRFDLLMQYVSRSVITGFVNALAILIFMAQLPQLIGVSPLTYVLVAAGLAIIYLLPRATRAVPSPLVAIVLLTAIAVYLDLPVNTVGDMGELPSSLPVFLVPAVPLNWETLQIIFPYAMTMAAVGLLESMLTAQIVDDMTETRGNKRRECKGQGVANVVTGFLGGMGGCAMIGQSVINVRSGGLTRLSTFCAGVCLLFLIVVLGPIVATIPMAALVAVMIMVSISTFSWRSILNLRTHPWQSSVVMLVTVTVVVWTHDLAQGVFAGVVLSGLFFANKVQRMFAVQSGLSPDGQTRTYRYVGQVFFASTARFADAIDFLEPVPQVVLDVSDAHFWDLSAVAALDRVVMRLRRDGRRVEVVGLNAASQTIVDRFGLHDKPAASEHPPAH